MPDSTATKAAELHHAVGHDPFDDNAVHTAPISLASAGRVCFTHAHASLNSFSFMICLSAWPFDHGIGAGDVAAAALRRRAALSKTVVRGHQ